MSSSSDYSHLPRGLAMLMEAGIIATPEQVFEKQLRQLPPGSLPWPLEPSPVEPASDHQVTSLPESGEVTSGHLESPVPLASAREREAPVPAPGTAGERAPAPRCAARNKQGEPCKAYPSLGTPFCLMHNPERADYVQENRRQGGRHRAPYQFAEEVEANLRAIDLHMLTPLGLQASLEAVTRMVLLGRIPRQTAAVIMRFFEVAGRNIPNLQRPNDATREFYVEHVDHLLYASDLIEDQLEGQRSQERIEQLSDLRSRYEERFRTEDAFGRTPRRK